MSQGLSQREKIFGWLLSIAFVVTSSFGAARTNCCCTVLSPPGESTSTSLVPSCCSHAKVEKTSKCSEDCEDVECIGCSCDGLAFTNKVYPPVQKELFDANIEAAYVSFQRAPFSFRSLDWRFRRFITSRGPAAVRGDVLLAEVIYPVLLVANLDL